MDYPLVSIIVPIYNVEKYLDRCLKSIKNQTYSNIQVIMINDGSTDSSELVAKKYLFDSRFTLLDKSNGGLSSARNVGINNANGEYICFVDSDDYIDARFVDVLVKNAQEFEADICCCDYYRTKRSNISGEIINEKIILLEDEKINFYLNYNITSAWGKLYKKLLFDKERFPEGLLHEDIAINFRLFRQANKVIFTKSKLYIYFTRFGSITMKSFSLKNLDLIKAWEEVELCSHNLEKSQKQLIDYRRGRSYFNLLGMIALYGFDSTNQDLKNRTICFLKKGLHENFYTLITSNQMPLNRKLAVLLFSINFDLCCLIGCLIRKIKFNL